MNKYIVVRTFCNNIDIANKIIDTLLEHRLVAGSQISKVNSKYWWNKELELEQKKKRKIRFTTNLSRT